MTPTAERRATGATAHYAARRGPVIVATRGEDASGALRAGHALGVRLGTGVIAASVLEPISIQLLDGGYGVQPRVYDVESRETREGTVARQIQVVLGPDAVLPIVVLAGEPARTLAALARERRASLIVVGTGPHDVGSRLLFGESALRIVRRAVCPVMLVPEDYDARVPARVAVAALDFSPSSLAAAGAALPLLDDAATLYLVHVGPLVSRPDERAYPLDEEYARALPGRFERATSALAVPPTITVRPVVLAGHPIERLLEYADSVGAELIVVGRQGHGLWQHMFMGSVSTGLVRGAPVPVLVTPELQAGEMDELTRHLTGVFEGRSPEEWAAQLEGFGERNRGRRTQLETDDPRSGTRLLESGYSLLGAAYDPHDRRVEVMLGEVGAGRPHLTHSIAHVSAVAVASDDAGPDLALRVTHGDGRTLLTFMPSEPG